MIFGRDDMKFASKESGTLVQYLLEHPEITDDYSPEAIP